VPRRVLMPPRSETSIAVSVPASTAGLGASLVASISRIVASVWSSEPMGRSCPAPGLAATACAGCSTARCLTYPASVPACRCENSRADSTRSVALRAASIAARFCVFAILRPSEVLRFRHPETGEGLHPALLEPGNELGVRVVQGLVDLARARDQRAAVCLR